VLLLNPLSVTRANFFAVREFCRDSLYYLELPLDFSESWKRLRKHQTALIPSLVWELTGARSYIRLIACGKEVALSLQSLTR
jgi:hypothetical protein